MDTTAGGSPVPERKPRFARKIFVVCALLSV